MSDRKKFFTLLIPSLTVFISSACIMIIELVASRLIARHLGSSLYTWTSVIGVVLAGITIGNYSGGRIADKFSPKKALSALFTLASISCVVIIVLNNIVGEWLWLWKLNWPLRIFTHISLVFLFPSMLLGTISPVVAKMALDKGLATGKTIGTIYAWGAAGSIAGTFLAGFYLIVAMGTVAIIWTIAFILLIMALSYHIKSWPVYIWAIVLFVIFFLGFAKTVSAQQMGTELLLREKPDSSILYQDETAYCYVAVKQTSKNPDQRLFMQDKLKHSEVIMGDLDNLQYFHSKLFAGITRVLSQNKENISVFSIGGGGYVVPQYIEKYWPKSRNDVAEIDPGVTKAATAAFGLKTDTAINTVTMDARNYVDSLLEEKRNGKNIPQYDFIYEDAFSDYNVPFQLVTREFHDKIYEILSADGVYLINMIDMYEPGLFLGTLVNTLQKTFPHLAIATESGISKTDRNTFVIVASKKELDMKELIQKFETQNNLKWGVWYLDKSEIEELRNKSHGIVLTDDFAPVENFLAPVVRKSATDFLATKYMNIALEMRNAQQYDKSIEFYMKAVKALNRFTFKAYNEIGTIYAMRQDWENAAKSFQVAIDFSQKETIKANIGSIYFNYGTILMQSGKDKDAAEQYKKAIDAFQVEVMEYPTSTAYTYLGNVYATTGDFPSASLAFSQAVKLNPTDPESYDNLAKSLEYQGRYEEAITVCQQLIGLTESSGQDASQARQYMAALKQQKETAGRPKN